MNLNPDNSTFPSPPVEGAAEPPMPSSIPDERPPNAEGIVLEAVAADAPSAEDQPTEAASVSESLATPQKPPRPTLGFGPALGWCFLLCICAGFAIAPGTHLLQLLFSEQSRLVSIFVSSSFATCLVAFAVVGKQFGSHRRRWLAVRRISLIHLLLVVLMVPPLFLVVSEVANGATQILDPQRRQAPYRKQQPDGPREYRVSYAVPHLVRTSSVHDWTEEMFREMAVQPWWLILLTGCLLPAVGEEAFCRGFLGRGLVARYGLVVGILLTSLLFGLLHVDPVRICATTVFGIAAHMVYLTTRTYWAPVVLHFLHNSLAFAVMRLGANAHMDITGQYGDGNLPPLLVGVAGIAALVLLWLLYRTRTHWLLVDGQEWSPGYVSAEMPPLDVPATAHLGSPGSPSLWLAAIVYFAFTLIAAIEADPGTPHTAWSYNERGCQRLGREEYDAAISDYTEAIRLDSQFSWAYSNRGLALIRKNRYSEALTDLDQAIRLDTDLIDAYLNRGIAHQQLGHADLALADYNRVLQRRPNDSDARYNRGLVYFHKGEDNRAIADFTAILQQDPGYVEAYLQRGHAYLIKKQWPEANRDLSEVIRLNPENAVAYYLRFFARDGLGSKSGAEADLREATRLDPAIAEKFR